MSAHTISIYYIVINILDTNSRTIAQKMYKYVFYGVQSVMQYYDVLL